MIENRPRRTRVTTEVLLMVGIPEKLACGEFTLGDFSTDVDPMLIEVKKQVKSYMKNLALKASRGNGIYFYGTNGTGKTSLASFILIEAYWQRYTVRRASLNEYISAYTSLWSVPAEQREDMTEVFHQKYRSVEFLCLEEIGKETNAKINAPILEDLLRYRSEHGLPTIFCTNFSVSELEQKYNVSVGSLIKEKNLAISLSTLDRRVN